MGRASTDGQQYPLPLSQRMFGYGSERGGGSEGTYEAMTYAWLAFEKCVSMATNHHGQYFIFLLVYIPNNSPQA